MSIQVTFNLDDDEETFVTQSTLEHLPRVGEKIWFTPIGEQKACEVTDVCHWIADQEGNNYHAACVYLKEIIT